MNDDRPDPDALLAAVAAESRGRGKLKIFLGANAGVGKTFAMLQEARALAERGIDVVIGIVETHGRDGTAALTTAFEALPRRRVEHKGSSLLEFDLEAALKRRPALLLVDELAHSNAPQSRHPKRWQDVEELLDAGIDVYTTVNIQHLESLNDQVVRLTGVQVWETIPDRLLADANEIELVDIPPDELLARLREGHIYPAERAALAEQHFFKRSNLIALRELALRETATRVDSDLQALRRREGQPEPPRIAERLLACIGPDPLAPQVIRETARLAALLRAPWVALYVETPTLSRLPPADRERVLATLRLAEELGAETLTLGSIDVAQTLLEVARTRGVTRLVAGKPSRPRWLRRVAGSLTDTLVDHAQDLTLHLVARDATGDVLANRGTAQGVSGLGGDPQRKPRTLRYLGSLGLVAVVSAVAAPLYAEVSSASIAMLYLLAVLVAGIYLGRGPAATAATVGGLTFNFLFTEPRFTFWIFHPGDLLTFFALFAVGLVIAELSARARHQARVAVQREDRAVALGAFTEALLGARTFAAIAGLVRVHLAAAFDSEADLVAAGPNGELEPPLEAAGSSVRLDDALARWVIQRGESAGAGTATLPSSPLHYVPVRTGSQVLGVIALAPRNLRRLLLPEPRRALDAYARQVALAMERVVLSQRARDAALAAQAEDMRNALLSGLSHDLRTPLAAIVGASSALIARGGSQGIGDSAAKDLAQTIHEESQRMARLAGNLLDMARLSSGRATVTLDWVPFDEIVGSVRRRLRDAMQSRPLSVSVHPDAATLHVDALLVEQVLLNLLENAIKYTPTAAPIDIRCEPHPDDPRRIRFGVLDRGPGVPDALKRQVFDKFYRGDPESAASGTGLGLALCKAIVGLHGGDIEVSDRIGCGAAFWVSLPVPTGPAPQIAAETAT